MRRPLLAVLLAAGACRHAPPAAAPPSEPPRREMPQAAVERPQPTPKPPTVTKPAIAPLPPMLEARANQGAALLDDGRVFIVGGQGGYGHVVHDSTEFFDPKSRDWSPGPTMLTRRYNFVLARLPNGRWLAAAGRGEGKRELSEAELFDPRTGRWTATGSLREARSSMDSVTLEDGRVLVAGGFQNDRSLASVEIYDPSTGLWSWAAPMSHPRLGSFFLARLKDGRVLAAGGAAHDRDSLSHAEIYDPRLDRWETATPLPESRGNHRLYALSDGRVLAAAGVVDTTGRFAVPSEIFDPAGGRWTRAGGPTLLHHTTASRIGGRPALIGGFLHGASQRVLQVFDADRGEWSRLPDLREPRLYSSATTLRDGRLLIAGGEIGPRAIAGAEMLLPDGSPETRVPAASAPAALARPRPEPPARRPLLKRRAERPDDYALVVGVERYKTLPAASFASNDARSIAGAFQALGVPEENVVLLNGPRAGLADLSKYVEEWLPRRVSKDSRVYFFFSGHGAPDVDGGAPYLMPWDADASFVRSTGFALSRLYGALEKLPAKEVIVALDSCFSGSGGRSVLAPGLRPLVNLKMPPAPSRRLSVLTASESAEAAGGLPAVGHGAFTYHLLEGLGGAADKDGDGRLTLSEWHGYARKRVILDARAQNREQTPTLSTPTPGLRLY